MKGSAAGLAKPVPGTRTTATAPRGTIELEAVGHSFLAGKTRRPAIRDVSFTVEQGEFCAVVGPSGCGKTTILNLVSGLLRPTEGRVSVDGKPVRAVSSDIGYMPAQDSLLPWRTVLGNVEFPLQLAGESRKSRLDRAREMISAVGLEKVLDHHPHQLSQGMRQRVAIARTFATGSRIILMDEPFGALDAQTRVVIQDLFLSIWERRKPTVILITHDVAEAVALADVVVSMSPSPGTVRATRRIELPRPRSAEQLIFESTRFQSYMKEIWHELRGGE
ncbi:ABC transporter ATP-binding protein [Amycolatopsis pithecellobii]|uniref:ATP-binding cassette domain-containing protein n=1 Tax=Amycolatopsis pithecellobii TaxID=664692 RepID=A0A6N7Z0F0_9PSEU|nr:ABC transporter ATP-binding protein [Amycolatopsis pithecellobii]MTD53231.1 ATP-binding cassette domain-containing protein [Amycolatopsis pithecellobii]